MSLLELFFPIATVALSAACYVCYKSNKPLREKAKAEREVLDMKAAEETKRIAQGVREAEITESVVNALRVLFEEARGYNHTNEENRRYNGYNSGRDDRPVFNRETREVFHKVLRVGKLEERMDNQEEGNKVRRKAINDISGQVHEIRKVIDMYT